MRTKESEEMYLETILLLQRRKPEVRSVDAAEEPGFAKSGILFNKNAQGAGSRSSALKSSSKSNLQNKSVIGRERILVEAVDLGA